MLTTRITEDGEYGYEYDNLYRLTEAVNATGTDESYTYDQVGNRLTAADVAGQFVYNKNNELLQKDTSEFTYDENGNTISKTVAGSTTNYQYDIDNRLLSVEEDGSAVASYYYDPFGRRLWKDVDGTKTYFHYADEGLVAEADGTGAVTKTYGYVPNSTWTTDPLFMGEGGEYYFYQNDHLGTPQKMTSVTGAVVWSAVYDAFGGAVVDDGSTVINNLRFAGQFFDVETGLHYNWHRYYSQELGRYVSADPIGFDGGINMFSYAQNNPINFADPSGLREWEIDRLGVSVSGLLLSGSLQRLKFISNCEDGVKITKTYAVVGVGLTVGLELAVTGESTGYLGGTNFMKEEPDPMWGMSVSGPSAGLIYGGTLGAANLDFTSYAEVYGLSGSKEILGASIFNVEGQSYWLLDVEEKKCGLCNDAEGAYSYY